MFLVQKIPAANKTAQDSFLQPHTTRFFLDLLVGKKYTLTAFLNHYCYCVSYILMFLQYVSFLQSSPVLRRTTFRPRSLQRFLATCPFSFEIRTGMPFLEARFCVRYATEWCHTQTDFAQGTLVP